MTEQRVPTRAGRWRALVLLRSGLEAVAVVLAVLWLNPPRQPIGPPAGDLPAALEGPEREGLFVGHTEARMVERFGPPTHRCAGGFGLTDPARLRRRYGATVTLVYERPTGALYLGFCQQDGDWVCFTASWLPKGAAF